MTFKESLIAIADIVQSELELTDDRVLLYNQKWTLPNEDDIFIYIAPTTSKVISSRTTYVNDGLTFKEVQDLNLRENIAINIFSKDSSARTRKEEIIMALISDKAQQDQEKYSFKIAAIPDTFIDLSSVEATARLNRYAITIPVFSWRTKEKDAVYFDKFEHSVITN